MTGCLLHPQELSERQLLLSLFMKFLSSLAGCGQGTSTFSHPRFYSVCVSQRWPGLTVWPTSFNLHWALVLWFGAELGGVEGWKHRVAL